MPALSPTMSQGNLAKWHVKVGDKVSAGTVLADVETDKATMAFENQDDGVVAKLLVPDGAQNVVVGAPVLVLVEDAASVAAFANFAPGKAAAPAAAPSAAAPAAPAPAAASSAKPASSYPAHQVLAGTRTRSHLDPKVTKRGHEERRNTTTPPLRQPQVLGMPSLSPTMERGNIVAWKVSEPGTRRHGAPSSRGLVPASPAAALPEAPWLTQQRQVKEGDAIKPGDVLADIETDKATLGFENQDEGFVAKLLVPGGASNVAINTPVLVIVEDPALIPQFKDYGAAAAAPAAAPAAAAPAPAAAAAAPARPGVQANHRIGPAARMLLEEAGLTAADVAPTGPNNIVTKGDVLAAIAAGIKPGGSRAVAVAAQPAAPAAPAAAAKPAATPATAAAGAKAKAPNYTDTPTTQVRVCVHAGGRRKLLVSARLRECACAGMRLLQKPPPPAYHRVACALCLRPCGADPASHRAAATRVQGERARCLRSACGAAAVRDRPTRRRVPLSPRSGERAARRDVPRRSGAALAMLSKRRRRRQLNSGGGGGGASRWWQVTIPALYGAVDVELDALGALRKELAAQGVKLSVNDFVLKAVAEALKEVCACQGVKAIGRRGGLVRAGSRVGCSSRLEGRGPTCCCCNWWELRPQLRAG